MSLGHVTSAGCFLLLAGFRAQDGSWLWAVIFAFAAGCQLYLGLRGGREQPRARTPSEPDVRSARTWRALALSSCALTAGMLVVQPVLGPIAAVAASYCAWKVGHSGGRSGARQRKFVRARTYPHAR